MNPFNQERLFRELRNHNESYEFRSIYMPPYGTQDKVHLACGDLHPPIVLDKVPPGVEAKMLQMLGSLWDTLDDLGSNYLQVMHFLSMERSFSARKMDKLRKIMGWDAIDIVPLVRVSTPYLNGLLQFGAMLTARQIDRRDRLAVATLASVFVSRPVPPPETRKKRGLLREQELECVKWAVAGKTLEDTAAITGFPYRTVRYHLDRARDRYGFSSNIQLFVRAAQDYDIDPADPG